MDDTVTESEGAIGDGQGSEKTGFFAADVVDSHDYGFVVTKERNAEQESTKTMEPLTQGSVAVKYVNSVKVIRVRLARLHSPSETTQKIWERSFADSRIRAWASTGLVHV